MRPFGTTRQLARRRQRALRLLRQGQSRKYVAQKVGATERSVRRWQHPAQVAKTLPAPCHPGRPVRLGAVQIQHLIETLKQGALAQGYIEDYWTLGRIVRVIWTLFAVRYKPSGVWRLLRRIGWSCQKPQRRSFGGDPAAITRWRRSA